MRVTLLLAITASMLAVAADAKAKRQPPVWDELGVEARIAFPNQGSIRNFEPNDDRGIWLEDSQRRWYYAEFVGPCWGIEHALAVGFDTGGSSQLDKFGAVIVDRQRCQIGKLITAEKPLPRKDRIARREQARADAKKAVAPKD